MIGVFNTAALLCLGGIFWQDIKDREVTGLLILVLGISLGGNFYLYLSHLQIWLSLVAINLSLIGIVTLMAYGYTRWVRKHLFFNHSLGSGDLLFFGAMALGFPTVTFLILWVASLTVALLFGLLFGYGKNKESTIPLAGIQSIFLALVLGISLLDSSPSLYQY